jgi:hypothetical protein
VNAGGVFIFPVVKHFSANVCDFVFGIFLLSGIALPPQAIIKWLNFTGLVQDFVSHIID